MGPQFAIRCLTELLFLDVLDRLEKPAFPLCHMVVCPEQHSALEHLFSFAILLPSLLPALLLPLLALLFLALRLRDGNI